jgi:hypothetical protein
VDGDGFADLVVVADLQAGRCAFVLEILRVIADRAVRVEDVVPADRRVTGEHNVGHQLVAAAQRDIRPDRAERSNLHIISKLRLGIDNRQR